MLAKNQPVQLLYVPTANLDEAKKIAKVLVNEKLVACANIFPSMISIYVWQEALEEQQECLLLLKTLEKNVLAVKNRVLELHSYEVPCVASVPFEILNDSYLSWLVSYLSLRKV